MESISKTTGIPIDDLKCFLCILVQIPLSFLYRLLPTKTPQDLLVRKVYGVVVALASNFYCFGFWGNIVFLACMFLNYYLLSLQCTNAKRTLIISFVTFSAQCVANIIRLIVDYRGNSNNISLVFMILTPRMIYFNWTCCGLFEKDEVKRIPSVLDYFFYVYNFIGGQIGPVYTYEEYDHFIKQTYPETKVNFAELKDAVLNIIIGFGIFMLGSKYYDFDLLEKPEFREYNIFFQIGIILVEAVLIRARFATAWKIESLQVIAANIRDSESNYQDHIHTINWPNIELENSFKIRTENWNMSIQKWLKNCFYLKGQEVFKMTPKNASLMTFIVSAFWHGFYPTYYICFFIWNLLSEAEKLVFKCPVIYAWFPTFIFRMLMDMYGTLFKRFMFPEFMAAARNLWHFIALSFGLYAVFSVICPIINKKYGPRKPKGKEQQSTEGAPAEAEQAVKKVLKTKL